MQVAVKNQSGETVESIELNDAVFGVPMNPTLVHQAMVIYQGNKRHGTHDTKTRAQVSGGGRKPWIQKHTGRARQGSTRAPQPRHGGVAFGPHPRSYRRDLPRRMRRLALRCVLSDKARQGKLICLDATDTVDGKTRSIADLLQTLGVATSVLMVTRESDQNVVRAAHNLKKVWTLPVNQLNAAELLSREAVVMTVDAARFAEEAFAVEPHGRRGRKFAASGELADETLVDAPAGEEAPVEEAPVEEAPVEETPVGEAPVEETPAEETPAASPLAHQGAATADEEQADPAAEASASEQPAEEATAEVSAEGVDDETPRPDQAEAAANGDGKEEG